MTIIHIKKRENPYVQIDKRPLNDVRLSYKARGILAYLLSKPPDWKVLVKDLINRSEKDGEYAIRTGLRELRDIGYLRYEQPQREDGTFDEVEYVVYEIPLGGFPQADNPQAENHYHTNNEVTEGDTKSEKKGDTNELTKPSESPLVTSISSEDQSDNIIWPCGPPALSTNDDSLPETDQDDGSLLETRIEQWSRLWHDWEHLESNITQAYNIWNRTDFTEEEFVNRMEQAFKIAAGATNAKNRMAYFFGILRKQFP